MVINFYKQLGDPEGVVEHFQGVLDRFCGEEWTRRFPELALTQQWYAAAMAKSLIRHIKVLRPRQVVRLLHPLPRAADVRRGLR